MSNDQENQLNLDETVMNSKEDEVAPKHKQNPIDFLIVSRIPQKISNFQWIIRRFSSLSVDEFLYSTDIHALTTSSCRLKLVKYKHGFGLFHTCYTEPYPTYDEDNIFAIQFTHKFEYQISAIDTTGKELRKWFVFFSNNINSSNYEIGDYINNNVENFPDDSLILDCNLKVSLSPEVEEIPIESKPTIADNSWKNLSNDFRDLFQNDQGTDITLIVGTDKIRAHKLFLAARSTVFKKTFQQDMKETEQNSVTISDVEFPALQRLVEFMYTGVVSDGVNKSMDLQELYDLFYAADKYEVMDLREMVGNTLMGKICVENASEMLVWADRHDDQNLKSRIMNYIRINFEEVSNTDTWESCCLHHCKLAMEVVNFCAKKAKKQ